MYYIYAEKIDENNTFFSRADSREKMKSAIEVLKEQGFKFTVISGSEVALNYGDENFKPEISLDM